MEFLLPYGHLTIKVKHRDFAPLGDARRAYHIHVGVVPTAGFVILGERGGEYVTTAVKR